MPPRDPIQMIDSGHLVRLNYALVMNCGVMEAISSRESSVPSRSSLYVCEREKQLVLVVIRAGTLIYSVY